MNSKVCLFIAAVFGFMSLLVGAATGHSSGEFAQRFDTVVRYLQIYAAVMVGFAAMDWRSEILNLGSGVLSAGVAWFSICLLLSTTSAFSFMGYGAPLGGVAMMVGWVLVGVSVLPWIVESWLSKTPAKPGRLMDAFLSLFKGWEDPKDDKKR